MTPTTNVIYLPHELAGQLGWLACRRQVRFNPAIRMLLASTRDIFFPWQMIKGHEGCQTIYISTYKASVHVMFANTSLAKLNHMSRSPTSRRWEIYSSFHSGKYYRVTWLRMWLMITWGRRIENNDLIS